MMRVVKRKQHGLLGNAIEITGPVYCYGDRFQCFRYRHDNDRWYFSTKNGITGPFAGIEDAVYIAAMQLGIDLNDIPAVR